VPQSLAICEYLEEIHPEPRLLPGSARDRATVRGMALASPATRTRSTTCRSAVTCAASSVQDDAAGESRWMATGSIAASPRSSAGLATARRTRRPWRQRFCYGSQVTLADVCLVPQMFNARRFAARPDALSAARGRLRAPRGAARVRRGTALTAQPDAEAK
jgi:maleylpyruvate isomerase